MLLLWDPLMVYSSEVAVADKVYVLVMMSLRTMVLIGPALTGIAQLVFLVVLKHSVLMSCCQAWLGSF